MAEVGINATKNILIGLSQKKVKSVYLMLALSIAIVICGGIFVSYYVRGRTPYFGSFLPAFRPPAPTYRFSILGEGENMMLKPMDLRVAGDHIYVTDTLNSRVQIFMLTGEPVLSFGSYGTNPGQLNFPYGIDVYGNNIYVADTYNGNISIFDNNGRFMDYFASAGGELTQPAGVLIDGQHLYVCNLDPGQILVYDIDTGELLQIIGSDGTAEGELSYPNDLTVGPDGNLYVSDTGNNRIQVFARNGDFIKVLPIEDGLVYNPRGLAFNTHGQLYVVNKLDNHVAIFDKNWKLVDRMGERAFNLPNGLDIDASGGRVYVTDHISTLVFQ